MEINYVQQKRHLTDKQLKINIMTKQEIIETLSNCIELCNLSENVYMRNRLTEVAESLIEDWQQSEMYAEQVKKVLNYDETMNNLNNLF